MAHFPAERAILRKQIQNRLETIRSTLYRNTRPINTLETVVTGTGRDVEPPPESGWEPFQEGMRWGRNDVTQWFRATVTVPREHDGERIVALLTPGGEALCHIDGIPAQGLDPNRNHVLLREKADAGEQIRILIDANAKGEEQFSSARIAVQDKKAWDLYYDLRVAFDVANVHDDSSDTHQGLLAIVHEAISRIDLNTTGDPAKYHSDIDAASGVFHQKIKAYQHSYNQGAFVVQGQSHLDTAWLWPLRVTRKKSGRTFATALRYMDEYPEYTFTMSQPQIYEYVKDHYPDIYARVKEKIGTGQWEVAGAPWVEQDLNLPSGESHVRQYLYGNRFFRKEFGIHSRIVWMPDCFGYTFSLPQIMKKSQIDFFYTTKLHGNEFNRHPYNLFRWRGLDGSEVLALQTPSGCNDRPTPERLRFSWSEFREKSVAGCLPFTFGYGDGGGGPTLEHIEYARRLGNMSGVPRVEWGKSEQVYERLAEEVDWDALPIFHDEMFYEKHRGCQTSQARTKRNNRKSELYARDTEYLSVLASLCGKPYDRESIYAAWKLILLNQFHDILPGSSIGEVYDDADADYAHAFEILGRVRDTAMHAITRPESTNIVVHNTLGWDRDDVAAIPAQDVPDGDIHIVDSSGVVQPSQRTLNADGSETILFEAPSVPSMGHAHYALKSGAGSLTSQTHRAPTATRRTLENDFYLVELAENGTICKLYDKLNDRHVLAPGRNGNVLHLFEDRPASSDAWDIDFNYEENVETVGTVTSIDVVENGPVRATIRIVWTTGTSRIEQDISLWRSLPRIDFSTRVDWHEKHRLLKAAFAVNVQSRRATYEIQYGAIERPTHRSTLWDRARFEVPAHRWIDLSEADYGVSLLNDCKYGFDVHENVMRISLLRSPTAPDPHCDEGKHEFVYSLVPHSGTWQDADIVRRGYELNAPLLSVFGAPAGVPESFVRVDRENVVIDCVKQAEDGDDVVVRLYEAHGSRGTAVLSFWQAPASVVECDLMEENGVPVKSDSKSVTLDVSPWEIRTLKVRF